jgi:undecaprenyl-diphosphatase
MDWLQNIDAGLFRFVNQSLTNPVFDWLMPKLAGHVLFIPLLLALAVLFLWKGGRRARLFAIFLAAVILLGDTLICNTIKKAVVRPRPFLTLPDAKVRVGRASGYSMPSAHAANWFAAATVAFIFYRRSWRGMVPAAAAVAFSRVYDGVHYPADILAGAVLGAGYAGAIVWSADALWRWAGERWWPRWWRRLPSLMCPDLRLAEGSLPAESEPGSRRPDLGARSSR